MRKQIGDQFKAIDAAEIDLSLPKAREFRIDETVLRPLSNPLLETNGRLANIEERFDRMEEIALDAAKIATNLQAFAADFLVKVEGAASQNERAVRKTVRWAAPAVIASAVLFVGQIAYTEFWRAPHDAVQLRSQIQELLQPTLKSDGDVAAILKDIRSALADRTGLRSPVTKGATPTAPSDLTRLPPRGPSIAGPR